MATLLQRWVVQPVTALLRRGAEPDRLAWSLALGAVVGVSPLIGSTTLIALGLAGLFRLNVVASQVGNHAMYPVEIALFPVFVKLGSLVFSTAKLPLDGRRSGSIRGTRRECSGCGSGTRWWCGQCSRRWRCR